MSGGHLTNNAEWLALRNVDWLARDLYGAIRRSMDFKTGIVGDRAKRISWQALREDTEIPARPGRRAHKPSEQQLRRCVDQLIKFGLVERMSVGRILRFRLLLATRLSLVPKKADRTPIGKDQPAKPRRTRKPEKLSTASAPIADTHLECPITPITTTPPNPPAQGREGEKIVPPTPAAREGELDSQLQIVPPAPEAREGDQGPQHRSGTEGGRPSEARRRRASRRGDGPSARHSEKGRGKGLGWKAGHAWPIGLTPTERRDVAQMFARVGAGLGQRVFDELRGAMEVGNVRSPWGLLQHLFQRASESGWRPEHADRVAEQRARWHETQAALAAQEAAHAARLGVEPRSVDLLTGDAWPADEWPEDES